MANETIVIEKKSKDADMKAVASMINTLITSGGDVVKELIRTAQSNPLVGIFLVLLLADIAHEKGLLGDFNYSVIQGLIVAQGGITITTQIIGEISNFVPSLSKAIDPASIFTPSATTIVNTETPVDAASAAELGKAK